MPAPFVPPCSETLAPLLTAAAGRDLVAEGLRLGPSAASSSTSTPAATAAATAPPAAAAARPHTACLGHRIAQRPQPPPPHPFVVSRSLGAAPVVAGTSRSNAAEDAAAAAKGAEGGAEAAAAAAAAAGASIAFDAPACASRLPARAQCTERKHIEHVLGEKLHLEQLKYADGGGHPVLGIPGTDPCTSERSRDLLRRARTEMQHMSGEKAQTSFAERCSLQHLGFTMETKKTAARYSASVTRLAAEAAAAERRRRLQQQARPAETVAASPSDELPATTEVMKSFVRGAREAERSLRAAPHYAHTGQTLRATCLWNVCDGCVDERYLHDLAGKVYRDFTVAADRAAAGNPLRDEASSAALFADFREFCARLRERAEAAGRATDAAAIDDDEDTQRVLLERFLGHHLEEARRRVEQEESKMGKGKAGRPSPSPPPPPPQPPQPPLPQGAASAAAAASGGSEQARRKRPRTAPVGEAAAAAAAAAAASASPVMFMHSRNKAVYIESLVRRQYRCQTIAAQLEEERQALRAARESGEVGDDEMADREDLVGRLARDMGRLTPSRFGRVGSASVGGGRQAAGGGGGGGAEHSAGLYLSRRGRRPGRPRQDSDEAEATLAATMRRHTAAQAALRTRRHTRQREQARLLFNRAPPLIRKMVLDLRQSRVTADPGYSSSCLLFMAPNAHNNSSSIS